MNRHLSNDRLLKILEEAPILIGIYEGPDQKFVFINRAGEDAIRLKKEEILGKSYAEVLPQAQDRIKSVKNVFETGIPFHQKEMPLPVGRDDRGNKVIEYINFHSQPYTDEEGKVIGVATFGIVATPEVTARNKLNYEAMRTKQILDNLATGFFSVDKNWIFTYANKAATPALGLRPEEVVGKHVWTLHPHLVNSEFYHAYHRSMNERVVAEVTNYYAEQDRWYHTISYPLDEGIAVSFSDITNRKKAEEQRALSDERFHSLTEAMPQMVWITDEHGYSIYFNARWMEKTGTKLEDNLGYGWLNVTHPEDRERTQKAWTSAITTHSCDVEYRVRMADGSYRWHVARGVPTKGEDGKIKQWVGTTTDIHNQKEIQNELRKAVVSRDEFLSIASHELKTPLTVIKLQSELNKKVLGQDRGNIDFKALGKFAVTIERNVQRLTRVVDDMLDISRISTGKLNLEREMVGLRELLDETVERMQPLCSDAGCELIVVQGEDTRLFVDRFRIEQVLINLLTNAIRYGEGRPITMKSVLTADAVIISVKDSGSGIAPEDHERIFERFERATSTAGKSGLGLGLFIVKNIIKLHGGKVTVKSQINQGAEFIVEIPRGE